MALCTKLPLKLEETEIGPWWVRDEEEKEMTIGGFETGLDRITCGSAGLNLKIIFSLITGKKLPKHFYKMCHATKLGYFINILKVWNITQEDLKTHEGLKKYKWD